MRVPGIHAGMTLALLLWGGQAGAVNLLTNPDFATDVSGWTLEGGATLAFSTSDANGSPASGSAEISNNSVGPSNGTGIRQCGGGVTAGNSYTYGGVVFFPTGQDRTGSLQVGLRWYSGSDCTGGTVGSQPRLEVNSAGDAWVSLDSVAQVAPGGANSVEFVAFPSKVEAGGSLIGRFDDLYIDDGLPEPTPVQVSSTASIPALQFSGLGLLGLLVGLLGLVFLRRR